jgi:Zn-dependent metalloprotease
MKILGIALVLIGLAVSAYGFDQTEQLPGTISRPGLASLPTEQINQVLIGLTGTIQLQNAIVETPKVMTLQYESKSDPTEPNAFSRDFISHYSAILKNDADAFKVIANHLVLNKFYFINLQQTYQGIDIWGARLGIKATPAGKVFMAGGEIFANIDIDINPAISENRAREEAISGIGFNAVSDKMEFIKLAILPFIYSDRVEYHLSFVCNIKTMEPSAIWRAFVDAHTGQLLWREDMNRYATIAGDIMTQIQLATPYDTLATVPLANDIVYMENINSAVSDSVGHFHFTTGLPGPLNIDVYSRGPFFRISNAAGGVGLINLPAMPGDSLALLWSDDNSTLPERDAFYHAQVVHDFIKRIDPDLTVMDFQMLVNINVAGSCNAFYQPWDRSINFYRAGGNCPNIAQIGDVVYHEWGHGLTDMQYLAGGSSGPDGATNEGFSDFLACIITNQSLIGRGFTGPGSYLRNIHNNNRYPDDWIGESHNDGLIISGALWDLRLVLADRPRYVDTLWQYAKYGYATDFNGFFYDMLAADDDDGNIQNGTPHANLIYYCFGNLHGIGPGIQVTIAHAPLVDSEDSLSAFTVNANVQSLNNMNNGTVVLKYKTGGDFQSVTMYNIGGNVWSGQIPNQQFGTIVRYYIEAADRIGLIGRNPSGAPDSLHQFYVGYDTIAPVIQIVQMPGNTIDLFGPYGPFKIAATDMHGVDTTSVIFHYRLNSGNEANLPMIKTDQANEFMVDSLTMGTQLQTGDTIHYWFTGRDLAYHHNIGRYPESGSLSLIMSQTELIDNFDNGIAKWQVVGPGWIWYDRQGYQSNQSLRSNGDNGYTNNMHSLVYRIKPYNFTPYEHVWLQFKAKYIISAGDTCFAVASLNPAGPWTKLGYINGASQWISKTYELTGFAGPGNEHVYYGFLFTSNDSGTAFGMLIDNVELTLLSPSGIDDAGILPNQTELSQNYPNPFNLKTAIKFELASQKKVNLEIYDLLGRKVVNLVSGDFAAGSYQIIWDGHNSTGLEAASGIYFYKLQVGDQSQIRTMTLIK